MIPFLLYVVFSILLTVCIHSVVMPIFRQTFGQRVVQPLFALNTGISCAICLNVLLPYMR